MTHPGEPVEGLSMAPVSPTGPVYPRNNQDASATSGGFLLPPLARCRWWQRLPPSDNPRLLPRLGVVRDAREAAA